LDRQGGVDIDAAEAQAAAIEQAWAEHVEPFGPALRVMGMTVGCAFGVAAIDEKEAFHTVSIW